MHSHPPLSAERDMSRTGSFNLRVLPNGGTAQDLLREVSAGMEEPRSPSQKMTTWRAATSRARGDELPVASSAPGSSSPGAGLAANFLADFKLRPAPAVPRAPSGTWLDAPLPRQQEGEPLPSHDTRSSESSLLAPQWTTHPPKSASPRAAHPAQPPSSPAQPDTSSPSRPSARRQQKRGAGTHKLHGRVKKMTGAPRPPTPTPRQERPGGRWVLECPVCGFAQANKRVCDMRRHLDAHFPRAEWACVGVPVEAVGPDDFRALPRALATVRHDAGGRAYVGGCGRTYGRKSSLQRHLRVSEDGCLRGEDFAGSGEEEVEADA